MNATRNYPFSEIRRKRVYFIGIGGVGMSALARWFLAKKWAVSGSDSAESTITRNLEKAGVKVKIGQKKGNLPSGAGLFVYNQAISADNPELREARRRKGVPVLSYAEAVGFLTRHYDTCAVAGSHGKSTTTSILSLALAKGGFDPTVIVGTLVREFGGRSGDGVNFRNGKKDLLVLEADEFHSSFLNYSPLHAIITNIDREHLDWYEDFTNVKRAFLEFIKGMRNGGILILNKDNKELRSLTKDISALSKKKEISLFWYSLHDKDARKIAKAMAHIPGTHMQSNAYAAFLLARHLGAKEKDILNAFKAYRGVWRRMEYKGELKIQLACRTGRNSEFKISIYDDYGHHPTEIAATLRGAKEFFKKKNIICAFQPHQEKRLTALFGEFVRAFDSADALFLFPVYKVAGRDGTGRTRDSGDLAEKIVRRGTIPNVFFLERFTLLLPWMEKVLSERQLPYRDSVLIMMGAGNINEETKKIVKDRK